MSDVVWTRVQAQAYDRRAIAAGIPGITLMENAGRAAADRLLAEGDISPVVIVAGKGNNGGDGFVIARRLHQAGIDVRLEMSCDPGQLRGDARLAYESLQGLTIPTQRIDADLPTRLADARWIVDALLGTGASGAIQPELGAIITAMNESGAKILAVDLPSGLDCDTGSPLGPTVRANITVTFGARKLGFDQPSAAVFLGQVSVADIGGGPVAVGD